MKRRFSFLLLLLLLWLCVATLTACSSGNDGATASNTTAGTAASSVTTANAEGLRIPLSELTQAVSYYDYNANGTPMQVLARIDESGVPHVSYNTCQSCAGSPYAYFETEGDDLVCQNCGNRFALSTIGQAGYGCMPMMLTQYTVTEESIDISAETLNAARTQFKNWKVGL